MTDISPTAPIAVNRSKVQWPGIPSLRIGASLAAMSGLLGDAFKMAYVDPYTSHRRRPQVGPDDDHKGRDPSW